MCQLLFLLLDQIEFRCILLKVLLHSLVLYLILGRDISQPGVQWSGGGGGGEKGSMIYRIAGNFRGRKLSRIGRKGAFRGENFRGMLKLVT